MIIYQLIIFLYLIKIRTSLFNDESNSNNISNYLYPDKIVILTEFKEKFKNYKNILDIMKKYSKINFNESANRFLNNNNDDNFIKNRLKIFLENLVNFLDIEGPYNGYTDEEKEDFKKVLFLFINTTYDQIELLNLSKSCNKLFEHTFNNTIDSNKPYQLRRKFLNEIILNLIVNKNDFLGFNKCIQDSELISEFAEDNKSLGINPIFYFAFVKDLKKNIEFKSSTSIEKYFYTIGLCLLNSDKNKAFQDGEVKYCDEEDYIKLIQFLLSLTSYIGDVELEVFNLRDKDDYFPNKEILKHFIPLFILLIPFSIKIFLFSCKKIIIKKRKKGSIINRLTGESTPDSESEEDNDLQRNSYDSTLDKKEDEDFLIITPTWYKLLENIFNLCKNGKELFNLSDKNFNNNLGLSYTNALIGINMFLTVIGQTYFVLFNLPIKDFGIWSFYNTIYFPLYIFIFIGLRYSPRVIFSCSGYTLSYKYLSFIAKKPGYYFGKFILLLNYKYFLLVIIILFTKYSLYHLQILLSQNLPTWEIFLKKVLQKPESKIKIILNFITFKIFDIKIDKDRFSQDIFSYFWIPLNETFFFIFGTILISLGYSCKISIDYVIIALIIFLYIGKIIYYYAYYYHKEKIYTTLYYYMFEYGKLMLNPLFNLPYFLIGMYFGLINYSIQRGTSESNRNSDYSRICNIKETGKIEEDEQKLAIKKSIIKTNTDDSYNRNSINLEDYEEENNDKKTPRISKINTELLKLEAIKTETNKSAEIKSNNRHIFDINKGIIDLKNKSEESNLFGLRDSNETSSLQNEDIYEMPFLKAPTIIKLFMRKTKKSMIYIFILIIMSIIILIFPLSHYIFISKYSNIHFSDKKYNKGELIKRLSLEKVIPNKTLNCFYLIDIELVIFFLHSGFFILYMRGQETINEFFSHIYWSFFNKIYFSFILVLNTIILYNFYHSDNIIKLNTYTIYVYSFVNMFVILIFMILFYIYLELPLKKLFKYLIRKYDINEEYEEDENEEKELNK